MLQWVDFLVIRFTQMFDLLNSLELSIGGVYVGFADIVIGFLALSIIATVFWKGAHT